MKKWNLEIESRAENELINFGYTGGKVDIEGLAEFSGIKVVRHNFFNKDLMTLDQVSGTLVIKDGKKTIGVNSLESEKRQRFTIAHELGHYFLDHLQDAEVIMDTKRLYRNFESALGSKSQEVQANAFAAALLMPRSQVIKCFEEERMKDDFIEDSEIIAHLAKIFDVSEVSMSIRLNRLGLMNTDNYIF